jgi:hypothetical protein
MSVVFRQFDLGEYRNPVQAMSDDELIKRGQEDALAIRRRKDREYDAVLVL